MTQSGNGGVPEAVSDYLSYGIAGFNQQRLKIIDSPSLYARMVSSEYARSTGRG